MPVFLIVPVPFIVPVPVFLIVIVPFFMPVPFFMRVPAIFRRAAAEQDRVARLEQRHARNLGQRQPPRVGREGPERIVEPGRQPRADGDDDPGRLDRRRLRGAQRKAVGRGADRHDQRAGRPRPLHHPRHQRLHRRDVGDDARRLGEGGGGEQQERGGEVQDAGHGILML